MKFVNDSWIIFKGSLVWMVVAGVALLLVVAPDWLQGTPNLNPFAHATDAARALLSGNITSDVVMWGFMMMLVLSVMAGFWGLRSFRKTAA